MNYAQTIIAARRAAEEKATAAAAAEQRKKEEAAHCQNRAEEFLRNVILPELEQARRDLEAEGISADVGNGQTPEQQPRHSLTVLTPSGSRVLRFTAGLYWPNSDCCTAAIHLSSGTGTAAEHLPLSKERVVETLHAFLSTCAF